MREEQKPKEFIVISCGPSFEQCVCLEPSGPCGHIWDGPEIKLPGEITTKTCSRCGSYAIDHDLMLMI